MIRDARRLCLAPLSTGSDFLEKSKEKKKRLGHQERDKMSRARCALTDNISRALGYGQFEEIAS